MDTSPLTPQAEPVISRHSADVEWVAWSACNLKLGIAGVNDPSAKDDASEDRVVVVVDRSVRND